MALAKWERDLFEAPFNWLSFHNDISPAFIEELRKKVTPYVWQGWYSHNFFTKPYIRSPRIWTDELFTAGLMRRIWTHEPRAGEVDALDILGRILCQFMEIPRDCYRPLGYTQKHNLTFFTNFRTIQVYCHHNETENEQIRELIAIDLLFRWAQKKVKVDKQTYHQHTDPLFEAAKPYIAWECIFPEGIDMEALSPRDVNAHLRAKNPAPKKSVPSKLTTKEKDHPPAPPPEVHEPPSIDCPNGAIYLTGRCLGKGGFAICHEGRLANMPERKFALKIVKSYMPQKKMAQKFQTELQIHSKMRHPNIVTFHRAFSYEKCTFIVLELCPNGSLMDMVKKRKYITEPEVRYWTVQMAGAIKYMHSKGIIHRDLKMGNIFLDQNMDVKVGDFGLAALLMSGKDWNACRRTTLCGTPNYIAPEILSKDKGGHDHAVDIWSLGIIIFAMLTGKPPFQSATADEIYRRAREREYDWPKLETSENFISEETKDLVSQLLQAPEKRPDPDTIVQHPFFTCGWLPQHEEMVPSLRERHPEPNQFSTIGMRNGRASLYLRNLKKMCIECQVGPWNPTPVHYTSTYREVADEEKAGLTPAVPLPEDVVYRPFADWLAVQEALAKEKGERAEQAAEALEKFYSPAKPVEAPAISSAPVIQSFAAQQRGRPQGSSSSVSSRLVKTRQPAQSSGSRALLSFPSRNSKNRKAETEVSEDTAAVEDRLAADLVNQLKSIGTERKRQVETPTLSLKNSESLFNPKEKLELLPNTSPDAVLEGVMRFKTELERALNSRTTAMPPKSTPPHPTIVIKWVDYTNKFGLGYILSNGSVGCIFKRTPAHPTDAKKGLLPPSCIVVRDAERHLQNRTNAAYVDRHQIVPISGPNIEFYENRGEKGIYRGKVNPQNYKVIVGPNNEIGKLARGVDDWDDRKREKIVLWKKFANYMTAFGRDQDFAYDDALARSSDKHKSEVVAAGKVVTFYQRFGDVGCWLFADGHFQFNFPDHTKIVLSADATWCDFYHLPLEAARDLSMKGSMSATALDDRQKLSYPLQTLLNFMAKPTRTAKTASRRRPEIDPMIQGIPQANDFRKKVEFIKQIVSEWVENEGIGNSDMTPEGRLKWYGNREIVNIKVPYKHVWVTVGARGGDDRRVAWFDPRKPDEVVQDIE